MQIVRAHQSNGLRKKGSYLLQLKTLFKNVTVDSPRYYLKTKWASLIHYQKTADLRHDVLPITAKLTGPTVQQHLHAVVTAQKQQLPAELTAFQGSCQLEREALPRPARTLVVGLDGGYVRHWHKKGCFEVIAGKSIPAEGAAKCFGHEVNAKPRRRVFEMLRSQGLQANQQVEFFTDGAPVLPHTFWCSPYLQRLPGLGVSFMTKERYHNLAD